MPNYRALDSYRFVAASLVAIGHFNADFHLGLERVTPIAERFAIFVDFFFVLSGFVIALNYRTRVGDPRAYGSFIWRRIARLWPLHVLVLVLFGTLGLIGNLRGYQFNHPEAFALSGLPWSLAMLQAWGPVWHQSFNPAAWSVSAELFVYFLFPVFVLLGNRLSLAVNLVLIAGYLVVLSYARAAAGLLPWYEATHDFGMLRAVPSFFLGVLVEERVRTLAGRVRVPWWTAHLSFALCLWALHAGLPAEVMLLLIAVFVGLTALAETNDGRSMLTGPISYHLGQTSYALYMVHMPLMACMLFVIRRTTGFEGIWPWAFALATYAMALGAALILYRWFEDPARRYLNALCPFDRRPAPPAMRPAGA